MTELPAKLSHTHIHAHDAPVDPRVHHVEILLSVLLRVGVIVSLFVVVMGTTLSFMRHAEYKSSPAELARLTSDEATFPHSLHDVWKGTIALEGRAIVMLGLLLLIATPVMRVAVSILAFAVQRDWRFVAITSVVLALLLLSFFLGKVE